MTQVLFQQLSTQLNFLLLSQRQMILICAFAVSLIVFGAKERGFPIMLVSLLLFLYAIAIGIKAALEFREYIKYARRDLDGAVLDEDERRLLNNAESWIIFSYIQIFITVVLIASFVRIRNHL